MNQTYPYILTSHTLLAFQHILCTICIKDTSIRVPQGLMQVPLLMTQCKNIFGHEKLSFTKHILVSTSYVDKATPVKPEVKQVNVIIL